MKAPAYTVEDLEADLAVAPAPYRPGKGRTTPDADREYLRRHYATDPLTTVAAHLGISLNALDSRARRAGLTRPAAHPTWTPAEDAVLARLYIDATRATILAALPGRTWRAIQGRCHEVTGLVRPWKLGRR